MRIGWCNGQASWTSKPSRAISSLIGCSIHTVLCHISEKRKLLNVEHVIVDRIFSVLFIGFKARGLRSISTPITIIIIMSYRQHGYPWPSLATFPYRSSPLACLQGYIPYPHLAAVCMFELVVLLFAWPYAGFHRSTSLMSSSLLLQQCSVCLVRLTWIVFVMGGRWPYSWCLVGCCRQDLFNIARNILHLKGAD